MMIHCINGLERIIQGVSYYLGSSNGFVSTGQSNYQYFGTFIASGYCIRSGIMMRYGYGNISTRHRTSADILFIKDGKPQIIFLMSEMLRTLLNWLNLCGDCNYKDNNGSSSSDDSKEVVYR
jgi:hypothetical protein